MKLVVLVTCLAAACSDLEDETLSDDSIALDGAKDDRIGNRTVNEFGGVLFFDDTAHAAEIQEAYYKVGFTLRAKAGLEFKIWARDANEGGRLPTSISLYGPKQRDGRYPFVKRSRTLQNTSVIYYAPSREGIYLAIVSARTAGSAHVGLNCGNQAECQLPCGVPEIYAPLCGVDGVTYSNKYEAACYDVPIAHTGVCDSGPTCANVRCAAGTHCEMVQVQCITTPCDPIPQCVPDQACPGLGTLNPDTNRCECLALAKCIEGYTFDRDPAVCDCVKPSCPEGKALDPATGICQCTSIAMCITGWIWDANLCQCITPCSTVRCSAGTHCEVVGNAAACVADKTDCIRTGCSGQVCADHSVITTCEYRAEYACYKSATCTRQADGACGWTMTSELKSCLNSPPSF
jgi:hypothetical protein